MLELAVLGLLKEKPMHGYELRTSLEDRLGRTFSWGTLYPTLRRLEKQDAIEAEKRKAEASMRRKKTYRITTAGDALFEELLDEAGPQAAEDREAFMMRLAFFGYARPETRQRLLERRRGYLLERLEKMKGSLKNLKERVDAYSLELMRYGESETERELRWLDDRLAFEAAQLDAQRKRRKAARKAARTTPRPARPASRTHVAQAPSEPTPTATVEHS